jgi:hypothetical protein
MSDTKALDGLSELWEGCDEIPMTPVNLRAMEKATAELARLRAALEKKETLIVKLKNTLVMDNNNRPAHLWDLLSALDEARLLIAFLAGYMSVSSGAVEKSKHDEAIAWLSTNKSQGDSDVSS